PKSLFHSPFAIRCFFQDRLTGRTRRSDRRDAGSNPAPGSNFVAVTGTATASSAKRGHAGSNPARNFIFDQALVAQLEERRTSNPGLRGFDSCRELQLSLGQRLVIRISLSTRSPFANGRWNP